MLAPNDDGCNPGRMCLSALESLEANIPPGQRVPAMRPVQTDTIGKEVHVSQYQSPPGRDSSTPPNGLGEMSFAQYCVAISAGPGSVQRQNVSSAFSDFSISTETAAPAKPQRKTYRVPSYGVLARFLPRFDRASSKPVDERQSGDGRKSKKTRLRKFLKKCRRRMGMKQQEGPVGRPAAHESQKDSVIEPSKDLCVPADNVVSVD